MKTQDADVSEQSQRDLAAGVLKQATQDLRRFHGATSKVERELYLDAYRWIMSDDYTWPFSFVNVCDVMVVTPAQLRQELIGDYALGIFRYRIRRCGRIVSRLRLRLLSFLQTSAMHGPGMPVNSPDTSFEPTRAVYEVGATP